DIVEEDDGGVAPGLVRLEQDRADEDIGAARLVDDRGTEGVVILPQAREPFGDGAAPEVGSAVDDHAGRFAGGVGIDGGDPLHGADAGESFGEARRRLRRRSSRSSGWTRMLTIYGGWSGSQWP